MSFTPGQQWPQQAQQIGNVTADSNLPNGNALPPPPPHRVNNSTPGNPTANMNMDVNSLQNNDNRNNPQFNRSRKLNISLTPLNAYGPSTSSISPSQASNTNDASSFARDPRNPINVKTTSSTPTANPASPGSNPKVDPRMKKDDSSNPNHGLNVPNESATQVQRNRSDPRLKMQDASASKKVEKNNAPTNDPRFAAKYDKKSPEPIKADENGRMNPLLAASQNKKQKHHVSKNNKNNRKNNPRKMHDSRNSRRQNSQYPMHLSRQNSNQQSRIPPPPPPKHKNRYGGGFHQRQMQQQHHHNNHHQQNNMNQYGPSNQNRNVPPPPPPKRVPPPPPGPGPGRGGMPPFSQHPPQTQGNFRGPSNQMNIQNSMSPKNKIPPPPPPRRPPNFQGGPGHRNRGPNFQGQGPRMGGMHNTPNNPPFQIPPPPPPSGSGPGRPMHPNQGPGHPARGFPPLSLPQTQKPPPAALGVPPGQIATPISYSNTQHQQQQVPPGQFPTPGIPNAQQHQQPVADPFRQNISQVHQHQMQQNPALGFPHHGRAPTQMPMQQPPPSATAVTAAMSPVIPMSHLQQQQQSIQQPLQQNATPQQPKSPWTEHTAPSGIKYYYNSVTKESTYSKPEDFDGPLIVKATPSPVQTPTKNHKTTKSTWREYTDKNTGKKYYSDGKTTCWEKPANFIPSTEFQSPISQKRLSSSFHNSSEKAKKKKMESPKPKKEPSYANKEEAIAAFKGLLLAKGISPTMKWADVLRICSEDYRWSACKTLGERKQALAEYQTKRANEEKEMRRQEIKRAKDAFQQLMTDMLPRLGITPNSRFGECRDKLAKDDRFFAVEDEETREELFYDFVEEMRKREERVNRTKKKAARDAFWSFMKDKEQNGLLTFASTWSSFKTSLDETSLSDPRFAVSGCFIDADRQLMFADYVIDLQAAEDEKRRRIRKARLDAEKAQRDAYRVFLRKEAKEGRITIVTRWRNIEEVASKDPTFIPVKEQDDDAPRMIFEDFVDDMKDRYRKDKHFLSRLISPTKTFATGIVVMKNMEFQEFRDNLLKAAGKEHEAECKKILNREPVSSVKWFFNELHLRAKNAMTAAYGASTGYGPNASSRMTSAGDESEDEGEIVEDGEVQE